MREILSIHVGQCGNQIADSFWRLALKEHGLTETGTLKEGANAAANSNLEVFFHRVREGKYVPRAVLIDLEPGVIGRIESGDMSKLFDESCIVRKIPGAANNWARGYHAEGKRVIDQIMNVIDSAVEKTKGLQGFLLTHSIGGGSGSGLGSLILERLRQAYPKKRIFTFSVVPSPLISDSAVEPYNAILTLKRLLDHADGSVLLDNEALFRIAKTKLNRSPTYMDLNNIIALIVSSVTASLRFPGKLNTDLSEFVTNLVPFPGNHFLTASFAPMRTADDESQVRMSFPELARETFAQDNFTAEIDWQNGVYLAASALFRGEVKAKEVDENMATIRKELNYASYMPASGGLKLGYAETAPAGFASSGLALVNHTGISAVFERLIGQFDIMFDNHAYTHWYENAGVSRDQMAVARDQIANLALSYRDAS
ncbi:tubulin alpha [Prosthecobacter debontii]|uniref:Tubulin alpha n=1 Tax=Prosthecobacter debontii TaxID=48467 RepID=A0A1T4YC04_9BACT|nr:tubulin beta chain [Prosthecobacter debontii]SKA99223.1 tubulin alpha [Prosthecobacter debontii]